jgi:hypothetical protein
MLQLSRKLLLHLETEVKNGLGGQYEVDSPYSVTFLMPPSHLILPNNQKKF